MKKNKFLACLIALATLISGLPAFVQAADAAEPLSLVYDFDDWTEVPGATSVGSWHGTQQAEGYASTTLSENADGQQIDIVYTNLTQAGSPKINFGLNNLAIAESVVIEERIRPNVVSGYNSSTGAMVRFFTLMNQDYKAEILPIYARGGTFYVSGGTDTPYSVDTWYTLRMVLNYENGVYTSYDLYIDSAKVAENIAMPTNFNSLKFVSLTDCTPFAKTDYSLDDFSIKAKSLVDLGGGEEEEEPPAEEPEVQETISIVETFDNVTVNENNSLSLGSDWYQIAYRDGYASSAVTPNVTGKQIDVTYTAANSSQSTRFGRQNLNIAQSVVIEERVKPNVVGNSNGAYVRLLSFRDTNNLEVHPVYARGGVFNVTGGTNVSYSANKWYTLRLVLNYADGAFSTYDLYINGTKVAENIAISEDFTSLSYVDLVNCTPFAATSYSFDDFSIKSKDLVDLEATDEPLSIVHNFDSMIEVPTYISDNEWYIISARDGYATSAVTANDTGKQVDVTYSAAPASNYGAQNTVFKRQGLSVAESIVIEEKVKPGMVGSSNGAYIDLFKIVDTDGTTSYCPLSARGGTFTVKEGTNATYSANNWYTLRMVLNYENGAYTTYDLYINDVKCAADVALPVTIDTIGTVELINCTPFAATSYSFDDFSIKARELVDIEEEEPPVDEPLSIVHNFDDLENPATTGGAIFDSDWYEISYRDGYASTAVTANDTGKQVDVTYTAGNSSQSTRFGRKNLDIAESVVIEEKFRPNVVGGSNGALIRLLSVRDSNNVEVHPVYVRGGTFHVTSPIDGVTATYSSDTWYTLRLVANYENGAFTTYDLYVDYTKVAEDVAFPENFTSITYVDLANCTPYNATSYSFDDFSIKARELVNVEDWVEPEPEPLSIEHNFDDWTEVPVYESGTEWYILGQREGYATSTVTDNDTGKQIDVTYTQGNSSQSTRFRRQGLSISESVVIEERVRPNVVGGSNGAYVRLLSLASGNTEIETVYARGGIFNVNNGINGAYTANNWYTIRIVADYANGAFTTYDLYIDGIMLAEDVAFPSGFTTLTAIDLVNCTPYAATSYSFDDFSIKAKELVDLGGEEESEPISIVHDFNDIETDANGLPVFDSSEWYAIAQRAEVEGCFATTEIAELAAGNKYIEVSHGGQPAKPSDFSTRFRRQGLSIREKIAIELKFRPGQVSGSNGAMARLLTMQDTAGTECMPLYLRAGTIYVEGGTNGTYEEDVWFTVKLIANYNNGKFTKYDLYINNVLHAKDVAFPADFAILTAVDLVNCTPYAGTSYSFDDFSIKTYVPDESELKLNVDIVVEDFEGNTNPDNLWTGDPLKVTANITNETTSDKTPVLYVAIYDANNNLKVLHSDAAETALTPNQSQELELEITLPSYTEDSILKAFVWEGIGNMRPTDFVQYNVLTY